MSEDKVKFRNTGPVHPLTRQPVADRKRFGGIKFGEMERDCLIAHGASANLHERLFTLSDSSQMHICQKCKNVANVIQRSVSGGRKIRGPYCRVCESLDDIVKVNVPYGAKLLCQELFSMGINLKFETRLCWVLEGPAGCLSIYGTFELLVNQYYFVNIWRGSLEFLYISILSVYWKNLLACLFHLLGLERETKMIHGVCYWVSAQLIKALLAELFW